MKISPVGYLNLNQRNKIEKQSATKPNFEVQNRDLTFGMAKISDIQKAQILKSANQVKRQEEIKSALENLEKGGQKAKEARTFLSTIAAQEFLNICFKRQYGNGKQNALEYGCNNESTSYIISRMDKEALKEYLKSDNGKIIFKLGYETLFKKILAALGKEEVYAFYSSEKETLEDGTKVTHLDSLIKEAPGFFTIFLEHIPDDKAKTCAKDNYNKLIESYNKLIEAQANAGNNQSKLLIESNKYKLFFQIIKTYAQDDDFAFKAYKDMDLIGYSEDYGNYVCHAIERFDSEKLAELLRNTSGADYLLRIRQHDNGNNIPFEKSHFSRLLKKLPPQNYPDIYSRAWFNEDAKENRSCIHLFSAEYATKIFPKDLLIELIKKDDYIRRGPYSRDYYGKPNWEEENILADKLGKKAYDKVRKEAGFSYYQVKYALIEPKCFSYGIKEVLASPDFKILPKPYQVKGLIRYFETFRNTFEFIPAVGPIAIDLACNQEDVNIEDSIKLLEGLKRAISIKVGNRYGEDYKSDDTYIFANLALEVLKAQQAQNS